MSGTSRKRRAAVRPSTCRHLASDRRGCQGLACSDTVKRSHEDFHSTESAHQQPTTSRDLLLDTDEFNRRIEKNTNLLGMEAASGEQEGQQVSKSQLSGDLDLK